MNFVLGYDMIFNIRKFAGLYFRKGFHKNYERRYQRIYRSLRSS